VGGWWIAHASGLPGGLGRRNGDGGGRVRAR
jgi:hypothetical protein